MLWARLHPEDELERKGVEVLQEDEEVDKEDNEETLGTFERMPVVRCPRLGHKLLSEAPDLWKSNKQGVSGAGTKTLAEASDLWNSNEQRMPTPPLLDASRPTTCCVPVMSMVDLLPVE